MTIENCGKGVEVRRGGRLTKTKNVCGLVSLVGHWSDGRLASHPHHIHDPCMYCQTAGLKASTLHFLSANSSSLLSYSHPLILFHIS